MAEQYEVGTSPDQTYVFARAFSVPYTAELALTVAAERARLGQELDVLGCLVDVRGTTSVATVSDKSDFAYNKTAIAALPHHWRYAFLRDHADDLSDFVGTFMRDAGFDFQMFENESSAIDWLTEGQSD